MHIVIIDYGMGNLRNVQKAFEKIGYKAIISANPQEIRTADRLVLPGVGAFEQAIKTLNTSGLTQVICDSVAQGKPLLGICLGMQLLFEVSYENGVHQGLGLLKGKIIKLDGPLKIPHIGWNQLEIMQPEPLFRKVRKNPYVYFVHSYHVETEEPIVSAYTDYGKKVAVAVQKGVIYGLQYHPEKSGDEGLEMLRAFVQISPPQT